MHLHRLGIRVFVISLTLAPFATAFTQASDRDGDPEGQELFRFTLADGSKVTGNLSLSHIDFETEFGRLEIPVAKLIQVVPGLDRRPEEKEQIDQLIEMLGEDKKQSAEARADLVDLGPPVRKLLREHREQADEKHRQEIDNVLDVLEELAQEELVNEPPLIPLDTVQTTKFTAVGKVFPQTLKIETRFGDLSVKLADVEQVERFDPDSRPDARTTLAVDGTNLAQLKFKSSGIEVEPGDKIIVRASGRISRSGSSSYVSSPEGSSRFGTFSQNPAILGGALVAKIGRSGKLVKVGSKRSFVATRPGVLQFAIGMRPEYVGRYQFLGRYDLTVNVLRGDK